MGCLITSAVSSDLGTYKDLRQFPVERTTLGRKKIRGAALRCADSLLIQNECPVSMLDAVHDLK